jgi:NTE family protein
VEGVKGKRKVAVACQGGGSHTAFTAGVLKKLLMSNQKQYEFVAFSGTSGGAICALLRGCSTISGGETSPRAPLQRAS